MADIFGYVTPGELSSTRDPLEVLASAATLAELQAIPDFDPNSTDSWARAKAFSLGRPQTKITNRKTGKLVSVTACRLES